MIKPLRSACFDDSRIRLRSTRRRHRLARACRSWLVFGALIGWLGLWALGCGDGELEVESVCSDMCHNFESCDVIDDSDRTSCETDCETAIDERAQEYGPDCEDAKIEYFNCVADLSCEEARGSEPGEDECPDELNDVAAECGG